MNSRLVVLVLIPCLVLPGGPAAAEAPSFDCRGVTSGSVEALVCRDPELSALDRQLAAVYAEAERKAATGPGAPLKAEQRGWIKGRDECWKADEPRTCVKDAYQRRIAELQARYRLVPVIGPVRFRCDDSPASEVVVSFYATDPATLVAERGGSVSLMVQQPAASGARYAGRNESFWEHQGEATVTWGYGAPALRCRKAE